MENSMLDENKVTQIALKSNTPMTFLSSAMGENLTSSQLEEAITPCLSAATLMKAFKEAGLAGAYETTNVDGGFGYVDTLTVFPAGTSPILIKIKGYAKTF